MNDLMKFGGKQVEVLEFDGQVLFNPYHCGECLDLSDVTVRRHIQSMNGKQVVKITNSDVQGMNIRKLNNAGENFLTESGVYKLIFKSNKPDAEKFQDWVTDEVIPVIRKHGAYLTDLKIEEVLLNPDTIITLAMQIKEEREENAKMKSKIDQDKNKVTLANAVTASNNSIEIGELAKILKQNGINTGEKRLFEWMRTKGYLTKRRGKETSLPTQRSLEMGILEIELVPYTRRCGTSDTYKKPMVTVKGQQYFINKFLG